MSSTFESGVGLCHLAVLASILTAPQGPTGHWPSAHGLATYESFAEDVRMNERGESFASCVGGQAGVVDVLACQELLGAYVRSKQQQKGRSDHPLK
jgi:hypothetical protein